VKYGEVKKSQAFIMDTPDYKQ